MSVRTLVLGGSQFVGLHLVRALTAAGRDVTVLNRGRTPADLPHGVERLAADRTDTRQLRAALAGRDWDAVIDVSGFVMAAGGGNYDDLLHILDGSVGHFVYVSSIMVYAPSGVFPWSEDTPRTNDPPTTYGGFKRRVEDALALRHASDGFPATTVRPAAIYGPDNNIYDMEAAMFLRLLRGLPIVVPHEGLIVCSYGHVDDLCDAIVALLGNTTTFGEAYNITTGAVTVAEYVRTLADVAGRPADVRYLPESLRAQLPRPPYGHLFGRAHHAMLSTEKARRQLNLRPRYSLRDGHAQTFDWFMRAGLAGEERARVDPLWHATYDFAWEAEVADRLRVEAAVSVG